MRLYFAIATLLLSMCAVSACGKPNSEACIPIVGTWVGRWNTVISNVTFNADGTFTQKEFLPESQVVTGTWTFTPLSTEYSGTLVMTYPDTLTYFGAIHIGNSYYKVIENEECTSLTESYYNPETDNGDLYN